jgi:hypothetical protein
VPKSWIPLPASSHLCRESKIVIAIAGFPARFRQWKDSGSDRKNSSRRGEYAKKAVLM